MRGRKLLLCVLPLTLIASGCATPTPYRPASASDSRTGYSDYRVETDRYRVSFSGNSMTSRDTVERYLLFRAAELALQEGADGFVMLDRETDRRTRTIVDRPFTAGRYGWWGPAWSYRHPRFGWRSWDPYWGDPFWDRDIDIRQIDRYEAMAEIRLIRGRLNRDDPRVFDARDVVEQLRGTIRYPEGDARY
ncbi:MAG: CC0125/CC1285 family lipoprotein [Sphingorhabdus sp.]